MALVAGAFTHVQSAGVEVVLRIDLGAALVEERGVEGVTVSNRTDPALPGLSTMWFVRSRHVSGKDRAGPHAADPPRVPKVLAVFEVFALPAEKVIARVSVEVSAESADFVPEFRRNC